MHQYNTFNRAGEVDSSILQNIVVYNFFMNGRPVLTTRTYTHREKEIAILEVDYHGVGSQNTGKYTIIRSFC